MSIIFLDLDGTLTDPKIGITKSITYALEKLGMTAPAPDDLEWVIGPSLLDSFARLGVDDPARAVTYYRERYTDVGLFENAVYDDIPETLTRLQSAGYTMYLATAKPHKYARIITAHFGLSQFLTYEFGPELDGTRNNKADLLDYALRKMGHKAQDCIMIGDRHHDFDAAKANAMQAIGVTWGYGNESELALADAICQKPADLAGIITRLLPR